MKSCIQKIVAQLPNPLLTDEAAPASSAEQWYRRRREIRTLLQEHVYGPLPEMTDQITVLSRTPEQPVLGGRGLESVCRLTADKVHDQFSFGLRIIRPAGKTNIPVIFGVFNGSSEEGYRHRFTEEIVANNGYAFVMVDREPATPDIPGADVRLSVPEEDRIEEYLYYDACKLRRKSFPAEDLPLDAYMEQYPYAYHYGKIAIGAHCVRLAISYVLGLGFIDPNCIAATGHSRNGKVALCAAVYDERIRAVLPHGSGCGGLAQYKVPAKGMERIDDMVRVWPSWLPPLAKYCDGREDQMPIDMYLARACIAPRGVMNCEGLQDFWAGPFSSYIGKLASQPVFDLLGVPQNNGMFIRQGFHDYSDEDLRQTIAFCNQLFYGKQADYDFAGTEYPL